MFPILANQSLTLSLGIDMLEGHTTLETLDLLRGTLGKIAESGGKWDGSILMPPRNALYVLSFLGLTPLISTFSSSFIFFEHQQMPLLELPQLFARSPGPAAQLEQPPVSAVGFRQGTSRQHR